MRDYHRAAVDWPQYSFDARRLLRRNYRWLRKAGVRPTTARLVLDSTMRVQRMEDYVRRVVAS